MDAWLYEMRNEEGFCSYFFVLRDERVRFFKDINSNKMTSSTQTIFSESRVKDKKTNCFSDFNARAAIRMMPTINIILSDFMGNLNGAGTLNYSFRGVNGVNDFPVGRVTRRGRLGTSVD